MAHKLIICGGNGAGKSTLGRMLARQAGWVFRDAEDYYFPDRRDGGPYADPRPREEVVARMQADLLAYPDLAIAAVKGDYGESVECLFTGAVLLSVPKAERLVRVRRRSYGKFGARMLPGGDLHGQEEQFFRMVAARSEQQVTDWLAGMRIPVLHLDGTRPPEENLVQLLRWLAEQ